MADSVKLKVVSTPAPAVPTSTPATASNPTAPPVPRLPELTDSSEYVAAVANVNRLRDELARLEAAQTVAQARRDAALADKGAAARAVLAGAKPGDVRADAFDMDHAKLSSDRRVTAEALRLAEMELMQATTRAKEVVAKPYLPHYRQAVRAAALAYLAAARTMGALDAINEQLGFRELRFRGGLSSLLPQFAGGDPTRPDSDCARIVRELLDAGILDEATDAAALEGLAVAPPVPVYVEPVPVIKEKGEKKPLSATQKLLKQFGVGSGANW